MAKTSRAPNPALLGDDAMSSDETALMDADRVGENEQPEVTEETPPALAEAAAQPEPALETEEHEEPAIDAATGKARKVDYGAFHSEREKRKAAEGRERKAAEENAKLLGRFETINHLVQRSQQPQRPQAEAPVEIPDINLDPVGHFQAKDAIRERELADLRGWKQTQDQQAEVRTNSERLTQIAQSHEVEFIKTAPDYPEAFQYLRAQRDAELQAMGYMDPRARAQAISNDALAIAAQALHRNVNAAEVVYNMAKARGWAAKAPVVPAPSAPAPAAQSPDAKKLATVARGQAASQSLGQMGGTAPVEFSAEMIAKMGDKEFETWIEKNEDSFRKMMGG